MSEFGRVDVLVNNAGVGTAVPATHETPEQFRQVIDVNLNGAYWMAQACGRVMTPGSSIVNISSVLSLTTAGLPQAAYAASKAGLNGLTRDLAQQWTGRKGIRVNAVAPGFFASEMTDQYPPGYLERAAGADSRRPQGRPATSSPRPWSSWPRRRRLHHRPDPRRRRRDDDHLSRSVRQAGVAPEGGHRVVQVSGPGAAARLDNCTAVSAHRPPGLSPTAGRRRRAAGRRTRTTSARAPPSTRSGRSVTPRTLARQIPRSSAQAPGGVVPDVWVAFRRWNQPKRQGLSRRTPWLSST